MGESKQPFNPYLIDEELMEDFEPDHSELLSMAQMGSLNIYNDRFFFPMNSKLKNSKQSSFC